MKRRAKILSVLLAASLVVSGAAPGIPVLASEVQQESSGLLQEDGQALQEAGTSEEGEAPSAEDVRQPEVADGEPSGGEGKEDASQAEAGAGSGEEAPQAEDGSGEENPQAGTGDAKEDAKISEKDAKTAKKEADAAKDAQETSEEGEQPQEEGAEGLADGETQANPLPGLAAAYYTTKGSGTNVTWNELKAKSVDYDINYPDDMDAKLASQTGLTDYAGVSWTGRIKVPVTGDYTFYGYSDNGFRLWIDGEQLINYWNGGSWDHLQTTKKVHLEADTFYTFQADYFEYSGGSHVYLDWSNDQGMARTRVPASAYFLPEDYTGLYFSGLDTSKANLKDGDEFDGHVTVEGLNFTENTVFEAVKLNGSSLPVPAIAEVVSVTGTKAEINLPKLGVGMYYLKITEGINNVTSSGKLIVEPSPDSGQARRENPRPDWQRSDYVNLNGWWNFAFDSGEVGQEEGWYAADAEINETYINVPFCWESSLSGVENPNYKGQAWYQKKVMVDESWAGRKIFLKFGAVDWKCKLWVNGKEVGSHIGGYNAFEFDVTEQMNVGEVNTVTLWVEDKGNYGDNSYPALIGKQGRNAPCGYTHTSGIWQTVGMEARSATYLDNAEAAVDVDKSTVTYTLDVTSDADQELTVEYDFASKVYDREKEVDVPTGSSVKGSQKITVKAGDNRLAMAAITVENPKLWNFNDPNLYYGTLTVKNSEGAVLDTVSTYFGMRKVEAKYFDESLEVKYIYVNNAPVFMSGLLDQGFWEGGVYTAPSEEALKYDILKMRECGFNLIRKHLKVEDPLQYYWCDKLGMMVWQDMPHATAMCPRSEGGETPGRQYYEECLDAMMHMNYNHPSIVAVMLFNETWGIDYSSSEARNRKAADGRSTKDWIEELYHRTRAINSNLLVEDMSPCNLDHVQPSDLNTYHTYPGSYNGMLSVVETNVNNAKIGSTYNYKFGEQQDGDPLLNSEYGGVAAFDGDYDVSYCFKYMTDIQRRYEKQSGFVYTEPFDVEYERNGIMTYDRNMKIFGYDEIAYGGDMSMNDLLQETYIGIVDQPVRNLTPGQKVKTSIMSLGWTNDLPEKAVLKWRLDGTDIYGNNISTGIAGQKSVTLSPYRKMSASINYTAPLQACVGTLTVWLENLDGEKIAKNFTNVIVTDDSIGDKAYTQANEDGSVVMKAAVGDSRYAATTGTGSQSYEYTLPENFSLDSLKGMRVMAEASSRKDQIGSDKYSSTFASKYSQTAVGRERPSDLTVAVNGVELDTVYLPDNPRDMRGTLSLNKLQEKAAASAGDFGYLVNLNVTDEKLAAIKEAMGEDNKITVTYSVKEDAKNKNGLRIYNSVYGRYAVNPTVILNPTDQSIDGVLEQAQKVAVEGNNYSVEAELEKTESYVVRDDDGGYRVEVSADGGQVVLVNAKTGKAIASAGIEGADAAHNVKATLFDEQIRVFVDNNPEAVINVYDKSGFTGGVTVNAGAENAVVTGASYSVDEAEPKPELKDVDFKADFSNGVSEDVFQRMGNDLTVNTTEDGKLHMQSRGGDKLIIKNLEMADGIYEMEVKIDGLTLNPDFGSGSTAGGNSGFTFRSTNYAIGNDGCYGYYAGIGDGCLQLGRMAHNWAQLALVWDHSWDKGTTHKLKVAVYGPRIQVYVDDEATPRIDVIDTVYSEGGASIRNFQCTSTNSNVRIVSVPYYTCSFEKGMDEWTGDGLWKKVKGAYQASSKGAYSLADGTPQKDIAVAADLKAETEDALPSIVLRAKETANGIEGYRAVLNVKENKIQFVKTVNGQDTVLAERGWDLETGKSYRIQAEADGFNFKVYLDEGTRAAKEALFAVSDGAFTEKGLAGIYSAQGTSTFDNFAMNGDLINGDVMAPVITAGLDALVSFAESLDPQAYTDVTFAPVKEALAAAKAASRYDQAAIDQAAANLQAALGGLRETGAGSGIDLEKLAQIMKDMADAKEAAELAKKNAEAAKAEAEKAALEASKQAEEAQKQAKAAEDEKKAAQAQVAEAQKQAKAAESQAEEAKKQAEAAQRQADKAQDQAEAAQRQADRAKEQAEAATTEKEAAQAQAEAAQRQADEAKKQADIAQKQAVEAEKQVVEAQKQVVEAQKQVAAAQAQAEAAQKQAEEAKKQADLAKAEKEAAEKAAAEVAEKVKAAEAEAAEAKKQAEEAQKQVIEAQKQVVEAQKQANEAQKQAAEAERQAGLAKAEKEAAQKAAEEAKKQAEEAKKQIEEAAKRAEEVKKQAEEAEQKLAEAKKQAEAAEAAQKAAEEAAKKAEEALEALKKAQEDQKGEKPGQPEQPEVKVGQTVKSGYLKYKVTSVEKRTVSVVGLAKSVTAVSIGNAIRINGKSFKITAIEKNAFKNNKKLTKVTVGKNVKVIGNNAFYQNTNLKSVVMNSGLVTIGSKAFYKDSKLKSISVRTNVLKSVGKSAFKGIPKNAYIDVPDKKAKTYQKLFKNAGQPKSVKIK